MATSVAVVGAGIMGRLLAYMLVKPKRLQNTYHVTIFDQEGWHSESRCSFAAAGMLAPYCELEDAEPVIAELGLRSLELWQELLGELPDQVYFRKTGSLMVASEHETMQLREACAKISRRLDFLPLDAGDKFRNVERAELDEYLAGLSESCAAGGFFPDEAHINTHEVLRALAARLVELGVEALMDTKVIRISPRRVTTESTTRLFDWVLDCRGLGASLDLSDLRSVRGELVLIDAPEVQLQLPLRLIHPRYPIYIVPRGKHRFAIGATSIESDAEGAVTVKSLLELLAPIYSLHPGFRHANVVQLIANRRPAFSDNLPQIHYQDGLLQINGLYRHGYLIAPALADAAAVFLANQNPVFPTVFRKTEAC